MGKIKIWYDDFYSKGKDSLRDKAPIDGDLTIWYPDLDLHCGKDGKFHKVDEGFNYCFSIKITPALVNADEIFLENRAEEIKNALKDGTVLPNELIDTINELSKEKVLVLMIDCVQAETG